MMTINDDDFDKIYKSILKNIVNCDCDYPIYTDQKYPFHLSDSQIELILDIPSSKNFKKYLKRPDSDAAYFRYRAYFDTCNFLLTVNNFENFTIERYIKILKYYVEARKLNIIVPDRLSIENLQENRSDEDSIFYLLVLRHLSKDETSILEKFIEENLDIFLDYFMYSNYENDGLDYPMGYLKFFSITLQGHVNFSVEFLEKYYKHFSCFTLYFNKELMADLTKQKLVFGKIKEQTLNSIATVLTSGKVHPDFKVKEDEVLTSIFKYTV